MLDISLAGMIGAFIGTVIAAVAYAPLVSLIERRLRPRVTAGVALVAHDRRRDQGIMQQEISLLRRGVLAADIAVFAGLGYWLAAGLANW